MQVLPLHFFLQGPLLPRPQGTVGRKGRRYPRGKAINTSGTKVHTMAKNQIQLEKKHQILVLRAHLGLDLLHGILGRVGGWIYSLEGRVGGTHKRIEISI